MRIKILRILRRSGSKNGRDWAIAEASCIYPLKNRETGELEEEVGKMLLPSDFMDIKPGSYDASTEPFTNREGRIEIRITELHPVVNGKSAKSEGAALA